MENDNALDPLRARRIPIHARSNNLRVYRPDNRRAKLHTALIGMGIVCTCFGLGIFGIAIYGELKTPPQPAAVAPAVYVGEEHSSPTVLSYGPQPMLSKADFFAETKAAFVLKRLTFIEANLSTM